MRQWVNCSRIIVAISFASPANKQSLARETPFNFSFTNYLSSADNIWKQFGPRSGPTKRRAWSGSKLFYTQMVFPNKSIDKVGFERKKADDKKYMKNYRVLMIALLYSFCCDQFKTVVKSCIHLLWPFVNLLLYSCIWQETVQFTSIKYMFCSVLFISDPYVKIYLLYNNQRIAKKKTHVKKRTLNPVFNESFLFDVPYNEGLQNISLEFLVLDWDRMTKNEVVGRLEIGARTRGPQQHHWNEVMNCPRKQIAEWHKLTDWEEKQNFRVWNRKYFLTHHF